MSSLRSFSATTAVVALVAVSFQPFILPRLMEMIRAPRDVRIGIIRVLSNAELAAKYSGKRVLIVGGTRGVGLGTALAVARGGADVTIVGRSSSSGDHAIQQLKQIGRGTFSYICGDIGTVASARELVDKLELASQTASRGYDYLVVSAAVFPDWKQPQQQEDGIDRCFAIAVVGRYILYKNMHRFMNSSADDVRVLNVMASGEQPFYFIKRDVAVGQRDARNLLESMITMATGNELMLKLIEEDSKLGKTLVSTAPGYLKTDLHRGQGWLIDLFFSLTVAVVMGISIEKCGIRQASILVSPLLPSNQLSFVSSDMRGRLRDRRLQTLMESELPWLKELLHRVADNGEEAI